MSDYGTQHYEQMFKIQLLRYLWINQKLGILWTQTCYVFHWCQKRLDLFYPFSPPLKQTNIFQVTSSTKSVFHLSMLYN